LLALFRKTWRFLYANSLSAVFVVVVLAAVHFWQTKDFHSTGITESLQSASFVFLESGQEPRPVRIVDLLADLQSQNKGRPVAIYLWAEWCAICKLQESSVQSLQKDQLLISVAVQSGGPEKVARVLKDRELALPTLVDPSGQWLGALGLRAVPSFMVTNANDELSWVTVGYTTEIGMRLRLWLAKVI
jgi:thiol:disulfide interchange protein